MVCTPVPGTPLIVAATTYLDEFTSPVTQVESAANAITHKTRVIVFGIIAVNVLLTSLVVLVYGYRITQRIKSLTGIAEMISVGDFNAEIDMTSNDELSDLAKAIGRMQESIRVSVERLRRRRSA
jgi:methyl-accepting chemotaxis protein